jgi:O-antigen/teichoic acid export membrane protein
MSRGRWPAWSSHSREYSAPDCFAVCGSFGVRVSAVSEGFRSRASVSLGTVGGALAVSSVLGYALLILVARWLSVDDYAVFLSTWGVVFGLASVLSVVEQEVSRVSAHARLGHRKTGFGSVQVLLLSGAIAITLSVGIAISPWAEGIFGGHSSLALLAVVSTVGFAIQFFVRGVLVGHGLLRSYGALLIAEATFRLVAAGMVAFFVVTDRLVPMVIAVVVGSFAWVPFSFRARGIVTLHEGGEPWGRLSKRVLILAASSGLIACLLTGYPAIVTAVVGDTEGLATLFTAISATRIPLVLLSPVQALAVPVVVQLVSAGRVHDLRRYLVRGGVVLAGVAVVGGAVGAAIGPQIIAIFFGANYQATRLMVAVLTASTVILAGVLLETAVLLALQGYGALLLTWGSAVVVALVVLVVWPGGAADRGVAGLAVASAVGCVVGTASLVHATRDPRGSGSPGGVRSS